ncbi:MAG TPA: efflux RND transporter periplasmic adaptor subunit [Magnetospirillum sp.]|jgi:RND family efflux transporter MFP subunit|nr:efflux RND transporter periplasmic adaptor subunit [Magnetospirillum sp.]
MTNLRRLFVASTLAVAGCALLTGCDGEDAGPKAEVRPVRTVVARSEAWSELPSQVGEIRSHAESDLGFKIAGRVIERRVDLGAVVHKGDILARLDEQDERNQRTAAHADLASAQASLVQADADERRQSQLLSSGWTTQSKYDAALKARDAARASVRAAEAKLRLAEDQLAYAVLRAPEDGAIAAIGVEAGQVVAAGQMVVRLADLKRKDAVFTLAETGVLRLPRDVDVEVRLLDAPQVTASGKIEQIAPNSDPVTRTYTVKVGLSNPPETMRLGMSVVGRVRLEGTKVMSLPASALFEKDGEPALWVVDPKSETVDLTKVVLTRNDPDRVLVTSGLTEGALVVTAGVQRLWPGLKVRILNGSEGGRAP